MSKIVKIFFLFVLGVVHNMNGQYGISHEIGIVAGPVAFQSDYGERSDFRTNAGNTGFGAGFVHYLNFTYTSDCNCYRPNAYFNNHFKIRTELSFNKTKFNHFGTWVSDQQLAKSQEAVKLKAMEGKTTIYNLGMQLEYYPFSIRDFTSSKGSFGPFIALGGQFSYYKPETTSTLGNLTASTVPVKYWVPSEGKPHGYTSDSGTTFSIVFSVGTRYKLNTVSDLVLELKEQYYFSNWVDGLNPNPSRYPENKYKDWNVWLNFGYIYYLDISGK